jgi:hypothetical protein
MPFKLQVHCNFYVVRPHNRLHRSPVSMAQQPTLHWHSPLSPCPRPLPWSPIPMPYTSRSLPNSPCSLPMPKRPPFMDTLQCPAVHSPRPAVQSPCSTIGTTCQTIPGPRIYNPCPRGHFPWAQSSALLFTLNAPQSHPHVQQSALHAKQSLAP